MQRPQAGDLSQQQADARLFRQLLVGHADAGAGQQLADRAFMHVRVLAQVDRRQVEAEHFHGTHQPAQAAAGEQRGAVSLQRSGEHVQVGGKVFGRRIGRGIGDGVAGGLMLIERNSSCRQPGIDAGQRAAVGLVGAVRRMVGRACRQRFQFRRNGGQQLRQGQFAAEGVQLAKIELQCSRRLQAHPGAQNVGGDERVAVAVAADPAADAEEGR